MIAYRKRPQEGRLINPTDRPVELRVHGVGGAKPATVLGVESVEPAEDGIADGAAGFFVPRDASARFVDHPTRQLEAYSWGGLTRARASRAAWLILAPFALTNLAGWMIEHDGEPTDAEHEISSSDLLSRILARLVALTMTTSAVYLACRIAYDLFVIQCAQNAACVDRWWAWPLAQFTGHPGRQLLVASVLPVGLLAMLALITKRSQETSMPDGVSLLPRDPTFVESWTNSGFWGRFGVAHRLGILHLSAGLALIGVMLGGTAAQVTRAPGQNGVVIGVILLGIIAAAINALQWPVAMAWSILAASGAYLAYVVIGVATMRAAPFVPGASAASVLDAANTTAQVVLIGLLALASWRGRSRRRTRRLSQAERLYRWALPPALMVAAAGLISAFGAGSEILLRNVIETRETGPIDVAPTAGIVASAYLIALVALVVAALILYLRGLREGPPLDAVADRYAGYVDRPHLERIRRSLILARLTDQAPPMILAATITLVVVVLIVLVQVAVSGDGLSARELQNPFEWLETVASAVLVTLPLTVGYLLLGAYRGETTRRIVGILWDVATFWPRWFHPFAPPSYGERAVRDLRGRLAHHRERGVLLSGHSQGSVLCLAALAASDIDVSLVAVVTHGSPVIRLYGRFFPEYVAPDLVSNLIDQMEGRWVNLYRDTDFIGGPFGLTDVDVRLTDPVVPEEAIMSHFEYERTAEYQDALRRLI